METAREFAARCQRASSRLLMIASGIVGNITDAEDIVQQAIAIAIEKNNKFESESHFVGWLAGVVRNCAINYSRKFNRRRTHTTDPVEMTDVKTNQTEPSPINPATGEMATLQHAFDDRVLSALQQIPPKQRSCLLLKIVEDASYKEISELMDIPEGTAMSLVHRGKGRLRDLLSNATPPDNSIAKGDLR